MRNRVSRVVVAGLFVLFCAQYAHAQLQTAESPWVIDVGVGIDVSVNGNVNSGAIGRLQGVATAILPQPYGTVYGTGIDFRFGAGWRMNDLTEIRGIFTYQSADADLVRLGDFGPSSLYAQYSDYKAIGLDLGARRYFPFARRDIRAFAEATVGIAAIDRIDVQFAAPQTNTVFTSTDFFDGTSAFTWGINTGVVLRVADQIDVTGQIGLRHVGGLAQVDQFVGTGLEEINNDSARLTFPIVIGLRFHFK